MSHLIPIVPSSPPPIDDGWEGNDDFGEFLSADVKTSVDVPCNNVSPVAKDNGIAFSDSTQLNCENPQTFQSQSSEIFESKCDEALKNNIYNTESNSINEDKSCVQKNSSSCNNSLDYECTLTEPQSNECPENKLVSKEESSAICDNNSNHSHSRTDHFEKTNCNIDSNKNIGETIKNSFYFKDADKIDQNDATSQGSLTDSGMYSNDVSPAPNTNSAAIPHFNSETIKHCSREQSLNSESSSGALPRCQSDTFSENTSHCSYEEKHEMMHGCTLTDNTESSSAESINDDTGSHEEHEESPEPLFFKPESFTEEEGSYFESEDLDGSMDQFYDSDYTQVNSSMNNYVDNTESNTNKDSDSERNGFHNNSVHKHSSVNTEGSIESFESDSKKKQNKDCDDVINELNAQRTACQNEASSAICLDQESSEVTAESSSHEEINQKHNSTDKSHESATDEHDGQNSREDEDTTEKSPEDIGCSQIAKTSITENDIDTKNEDKTQTAQEVNESNPMQNTEEFCDFPVATEDDDFGGFEAFGNEYDVKVAEDTGGWAAFDTGTENTAADDGDDWAAFSEPVIVDSQAQDGHSQDDKIILNTNDEKDDFENEDFCEFSSHTESTGEQLEKSEESLKSSKVIHVDKALDSCFINNLSDKNANEIQLNSNEDHLLFLVSKENCIQEEVISKQPGRLRETKSFVEIDLNMWSHLKDMENTQGLKFQWTNSHANQMLLRAINIDTRNMLMGHKKHAVPIFASGLGLLEPKASNNPIEPSSINLSMHHSDKNLNSSFIIDTSKTSALRSGNIAQDLPPVDFDWKDSGLTNPLDAQEKERAILQALETSQDKVSKRVQPLENILANFKFTSTVSKTMQPLSTDKKLSSQANDVVLQLPDFSFMKARVLMFPVKPQSIQQNFETFEEKKVAPEEEINKKKDMKYENIRGEKVAEMF